MNCNIQTKFFNLFIKYSIYIREERLRLLHEVFDDKDNNNFSQRLGILTQIIDQLENVHYI